MLIDINDNKEIFISFERKLNYKYRIICLVLVICYFVTLIIAMCGTL